MSSTSPSETRSSRSLADRGAGNPDLGGEFLLIEELALHFRIDQYVFAQVGVRLLPAGGRRP